jgi:hypothetical protein
MRQTDNLFRQIKDYHLRTNQVESGTHGHMGISNPYQKNHAHKLTEHTRPQNDATPSPDAT